MRHLNGCFLSAALLVANLRADEPMQHDSEHTQDRSSAMEGMDHQAHSMHMHGAYGEYSMKREASGTSWQPEATPMGGLHIMSGEWMFMVHGFADLVYDLQGGKRGDDAFYGPN